jgi:hypothetical protein
MYTGDAFPRSKADGADDNHSRPSNAEDKIGGAIPSLLHGTVLH